MVDRDEQKSKDNTLTGYQDQRNKKESLKGIILEQENYNSKREDLEEKDQGKGERKNQPNGGYLLH